MRKKHTGSALYIGAVVVFMYLPILAVMVYSFSESKIAGIWGGFSMKWYGALMNDRGMMRSIGNSLIVALMSSATAAVLGTITALVTSDRRNRMGKAIERMMLLPMIIPEVVLAMVLMAFYSFLALPQGFLTLWLSHSTFCIPYVAIMVSASLRSMDTSVVEAARDLGSGPVGAFFRVELPMLLPGVLSGSLFAFAMSFDDVIISVFVSGPKTTTLPLRVYTAMKTVPTPEINAVGTVCFLVSAVAAVIFLAIYRRIQSDEENK